MKTIHPNDHDTRTPLEQAVDEVLWLLNQETGETSARTISDLGAQPLARHIKDRLQKARDPSPEKAAA